MSEPHLPLALFGSSRRSTVYYGSSDAGLNVVDFPSVGPILRVSTVLPSVVALISGAFNKVIFPSFLMLFSFVSNSDLCGLLVLGGSSLLFGTVFVPGCPGGPCMVGIGVPPAVNVRFVGPPGGCTVAGPVVEPVRPGGVSI